MDNTNLAVKLCRRMTEIEGILLQGGLSSSEEQSLAYEYIRLDIAINEIEVANDPKTTKKSE